MDIEPLEIYARDTNYAVIKPPGRHCLGAVIQGESLGILFRTAFRLAAMVDADTGSSEDLGGETEDLADALLDRVLTTSPSLTHRALTVPTVVHSPRLIASNTLPDDDN